MQFTDILPEFNFATNLVLAFVELYFTDDPHWPTIQSHLKLIIEDNGLIGRLWFPFDAGETESSISNYLSFHATEGSNNEGGL